ncbi:hypothetical protein [Haloechinothrix salitolerans]|uniref:Secreted protein n=1 Tax=Haloechinothrix salitolerans TaxID=926830 RepID=A0ABW2C8H4_9PSEU
MRDTADRARYQTVPQQPDDARSLLAALLALPGRGLRSVIRSAAMTPGRLTVIAVGLIVLTALAALTASFAVRDRSDTLTDLTERREPLAAAAQQVYRALSDADATAASAFLATGEEPEELRQRYENDIAMAGSSLSKAASDPAATPRMTAQIDVISQQLPVYTGLVETARTNNRQGFPVGASYLREASALMRTVILPAAEALYRIDTERVAEQQDDAGGFPVVAMLFVIALLAALIATQLHLKRLTNRVLNVGLVMATLAIGVGVLWSVAALTVQSVYIGNGKDDGTEQVDLLVQARIAALKSRADETLTLVARGDGGAYEEEFVRLSGRMAGDDGGGGWLADVAADATDGTPLASEVALAQESAEKWLRAHAKVRELDNAGDYAEAVQLAIDVGKPDGAAVAFVALDDHLRAAIEEARQAFHDDTTAASQVLTLLAPGWIVLGIIAALGIGAGIRERLREYQ